MENEATCQTIELDNTLYLAKKEKKGIKETIGVEKEICKENRFNEIDKQSNTKKGENEHRSISEDIESENTISKQKTGIESHFENTKNSFIPIKVIIKNDNKRTDEGTEKFELILKDNFFSDDSCKNSKDIAIDKKNVEIENSILLENRGFNLEKENTYGSNMNMEKSVYDKYINKINKLYLNIKNKMLTNDISSSNEKNSHIQLLKEEELEKLQETEGDKNNFNQFERKSSCNDFSIKQNTKGTRKPIKETEFCFFPFKKQTTNFSTNLNNALRMTPDFQNTQLISNSRSSNNFSNSNSNINNDESINTDFNSDGEIIDKNLSNQTMVNNEMKKNNNSHFDNFNSLHYISTNGFYENQKSTEEDIDSKLCIKEKNNLSKAKKVYSEDDKIFTKKNMHLTTTSNSDSNSNEVMHGDNKNIFNMCNYTKISSAYSKALNKREEETFDVICIKDNVTFMENYLSNDKIEITQKKEYENISTIDEKKKIHIQKYATIPLSLPTQMEINRSLHCTNSGNKTQMECRNKSTISASEKNGIYLSPAPKKGKEDKDVVMKNLSEEKEKTQSENRKGVVRNIRNLKESIKNNIKASNGVKSKEQGKNKKMNKIQNEIGTKRKKGRHSFESHYKTKSNAKWSELIESVQLEQTAHFPEKVSYDSIDTVCNNSIEEMEKKKLTHQNNEVLENRQNEKYIINKTIPNDADTYEQKEDKKQVPEMKTFQTGGTNTTKKYISKNTVMLQEKKNTLTNNKEYKLINKKNVIDNKMNKKVSSSDIGMEKINKKDNAYRANIEQEMISENKNIATETSFAKNTKNSSAISLKKRIFFEADLKNYKVKEYLKKKIEEIIEKDEHIKTTIEHTNVEHEHEKINIENVSSNISNLSSLKPNVYVNKTNEFAEKEETQSFSINSLYTPTFTIYKKKRKTILNEDKVCKENYSNIVQKENRDSFIFDKKIDKITKNIKKNSLLDRSKSDCAKYSKENTKNGNHLDISARSQKGEIGKYSSKKIVRNKSCKFGMETKEQNKEQNKEQKKQEKYNEKGNKYQGEFDDEYEADEWDEEKCVEQCFKHEKSDIINNIKKDIARESNVYRYAKCVTNKKANMNIKNKKNNDNQNNNTNKFKYLKNENTVPYLISYRMPNLSNIKSKINTRISKKETKNVEHSKNDMKSNTANRINERKHIIKNSYLKSNNTLSSKINTNSLTNAIKKQGLNKTPHQTGSSVTQKKNDSSYFIKVESPLDTKKNYEHNEISTKSNKNYINKTSGITKNNISSFIKLEEEIRCEELQEKLLNLNKKKKLKVENSSTTNKSTNRVTNGDRQSYLKNKSKDIKKLSNKKLNSHYVHNKNTLTKEKLHLKKSVNDTIKADCTKSFAQHISYLKKEPLIKKICDDDDILSMKKPNKNTFINSTKCNDQDVRKIKENETSTSHINSVGNAVKNVYCTTNADLQTQFSTVSTCNKYGEYQRAHKIHEKVNNEKMSNIKNNFLCVSSRRNEYEKNYMQPSHIINKKNNDLAKRKNSVYTTMNKNIVETCNSSYKNYLEQRNEHTIYTGTTNDIVKKASFGKSNTNYIGTANYLQRCE